jgi:carbon storage regulator
MLVLARRIGESIKIGDDVTVTVLAATATQVRIGIDAPEAIPVHRQEVYRRIHSLPPSRSEEPRLSKYSDKDN